MSQRLQNELNALYHEIKAMSPVVLALGERIAVLEKATGVAAPTETVDATARADIAAISEDLGALHTRVEALENMDFEGLAAEAAAVAAPAAAQAADPQHVDDTQFTADNPKPV